ncbi:hypothetical protein BDV06DRAFT_181418 [Aspergillus oleicola]
MEPPEEFRGFSRLNSKVCLYTSSQTPRNPNEPLTLIVVCSWLFAAPKHIAKYIQLYQNNLLAADILLIQPVVGDMIWTSDAAQLRQLSPAVAAIDAFLATSHGPNRHLVLHVFSNAGSHAAVQLEEAYQALHRSASLPVTALVLDSCPGAPSAMLSANAMIRSLPKSLLIKIIGVALIYCAVGVVGLLDSLGVYENVISKTRRALNNPSGCFLRADTARIYLYRNRMSWFPGGISWNMQKRLANWLEKGVQCKQLSFLAVDMSGTLLLLEISMSTPFYQRLATGSKSRWLVPFNACEQKPLASPFVNVPEHLRGSKLCGERSI